MPAFDEGSHKGMTVWGVFYPTGYIVAVFAECARAQAAQAALTAAGFEDTRFWTGQAVLERGATVRAERNVLERVGAHVSGQAAAALAEYVQAAEFHHCFVTTHIADQAQIAHAHALLAAHNAYLIRYYAPTGTVDLHEQRPTWQAPMPGESAPDRENDPAAPAPGRDPAW